MVSSDRVKEVPLLEEFSWSWISCSDSHSGVGTFRWVSGRITLLVGVGVILCPQAGSESTFLELARAQEVGNSGVFDGRTAVSLPD